LGFHCLKFNAEVPSTASMKGDVLPPRLEGKFKTLQMCLVVESKVEELLQPGITISKPVRVLLSRFEVLFVFRGVGPRPSGSPLYVLNGEVPSSASVTKVLLVLGSAQKAI
jgi:hypothetical protein